MSKSILSKIVIFAAGAAIGSAVTWKLVKTKYEQIARDEIQAVKEALLDREIEEEEAKEFADLGEPITQGFEDVLKSEKPPINELVTIIKENQYFSYSNVSESKEDEGIDKVGRPYVITPEEFGENEEYDTESLTYYADEVLTDDMDNPIEDVESVVGYDSLNHFGEYEDDSVFVRNDRNKTDYEILLDLRAYSDVIKNKPHLAED